MKNTSPKSSDRKLRMHGQEVAAGFKKQEEEKHLQPFARQAQMTAWKVIEKLLETLPGTCKQSECFMLLSGCRRRSSLIINTQDM